MAVKYVKDFEFPSDFGFHKNGSASVPGKHRVGKYANGGHTTPQPYKHGGKTDRPVKATRKEVGSGVQKPAFAHGGHTTPYAYKDGGKTKVAADKVKMGAKTPWNPDDAVSPGSFKRTPPSEKASNMKAANSKFDAEGRNTEPATKQTGDVERMAGYSDFKRGGKVKKHAKGGHSTPMPYKEGGHAKGCACKMCSGGSAMKSGGHERIKNLGHYAHGGKIKAPVKAGGKESTEKPKDGAAATRSETKSGNAMGKHTAPAAGSKRHNAKEHKVSATRSEKGPHGEKHMSSGGLSRGPNKKKEAAIHAKMGHGPAMGGMGALAAMAPPPQPHMAPPPGLGTPPPGAPMGGGMRPPPMGGAPGGGMPPGAPMMAHGGKVTHVVHHVIRH